MCKKISLINVLCQRWFRLFFFFFLMKTKTVCATSFYSAYLFVYFLTCLMLDLNNNAWTRIPVFSLLRMSPIKLLFESGNKHNKNTVSCNLYAITENI
jgi:hypothetical protein